MKPRICLIHAVRVAIDPVAEAFARLWPEAELMNLLDDSLSVDRQLDGELTPKITERFQTLARYAADVGVNGILFTCSAFGPAIEAVKKKFAPLPVLKPNEAMFEEALKSGARLGLLASFELSLARADGRRVCGTGKVAQQPRHAGHRLRAGRDAGLESRRCSDARCAAR